MLNLSNISVVLPSLDPDDKLLTVINGLLDIGYDGYFTFEVNAFTPERKRRPSARDDRLFTPPIELRDAFERYLYELGKCVLQKYDLFEE